MREECVAFDSRGAKLSGTLLLPSGGCPHPAVVSLHGSGREDRSFNLSLGRHFAKAGIAWLAYDKRGVGKSTGDWFRLIDRPRSFHILAEDAIAGLRFLLDRNEIDAHHIGIWGASQGGYVGVLATALCDDVAFVVCVSTPGVDTDRQMAYAITRGLESRGFGPMEVDAVLRQRARCMEMLRLAAVEEGKYREFEEFVHEAMKGIHQEFVVPRAWVEQGDIRTNLASIVEAEKSRPGYCYDPKPFFQRIRVPLLALSGENDNLVPVEESRAVISQALKEAGNDRFEIKTFPGADHNLRTASGSMVPGYTELMIEWLHKNLPTAKA